jgi:CitMHS family citrate-Mg2+:H+ or citrate-Ca2+:H+ symporter
MLTWLGLLAIVTLVALILFRVTSVLVALALVPVAFAIAGGMWREVGGFAFEGIKGVLPVAALLAFAVIYFGVMNDAGLFQPAIRALVRGAGRDPVKIALGTAAIATIAHLDGAGASTFLVTIPALLPLYRAAGMDPGALTCVTALAAGTMNILPWGGPTVRAAASLEVGANALFLPVLPAMSAGLLSVFGFAAIVGRGERRRLAREAPAEAAGAPHAPPAPTSGARTGPVIWWFNAALTLATLVALFVEALPLPVVFVIASAIALLANFPSAHAQRERLSAHGSHAMLMVTTLVAAGVFTGVLSRSGMLASLARDLVAVLPGAALRHLPPLLGLASMPLSLAFDPDSFYFGLLPVLASAAAAAGGSAVEVGRAAILGQMTTGFPVSPLTPSTFLLVGLAEVDLADHQRRTIPNAFATSAIMTIVALATGAIAW